MALDKDGIAKRIAQELQDRFYVNLGIGTVSYTHLRAHET